MGIRLTQVVHDSLRPSFILRWMDPPPQNFMHPHARLLFTGIQPETLSVPEVDANESSTQDKTKSAKKNPVAATDRVGFPASLRWNDAITPSWL
jgi:hypothetical protein